MSFIGNILNITNETELIVGCGTLILALATFRSVYQYKRRDQEIKNREALEKIIEPILINLRIIISNLENIQIPQFVTPKHAFWGNVKEENFYLLGNLDKRNIDKMEKFSKTFEKYFYFHKQNIKKLSEIVEKLIKNKLHKEISWNRPVEEGVFYQATIGGKPLCSSGSPHVKILYLVLKIKR